MDRSFSRQYSYLLGFLRYGEKSLPFTLGKIYNDAVYDVEGKVYGCFEREVRLSFKALMEVMLEDELYRRRAFLDGFLDGRQY